MEITFDYVFGNLVFSTEVYNVGQQLCCGQQDSKIILQKELNHSVCCGDVQYNPKTNDCCGNPPKICDISGPFATDSHKAPARGLTGVSPSHYCTLSNT